ncbi:hypothetical protein SprV_0301085700 [Sparganum proliferum]
MSPPCTTTAARNAGLLNGPQGQGHPGIRLQQRIEEVLPCDQSDLRSSAKGVALLLSSDRSTRVTEKSQILIHWTEHFRNVLNRPSTISDNANDRLPRVAIGVHLVLLPSLPEIIRTAQQLFNGKATGSNTISVKT